MNCCDKNNQKTQDEKSKKERGILTGLIYGLVPHIGCIAFIVFSILGVTFVTSIFRPLLLNPYFFHILVGLSIVFATISAVIYLKKNKILFFAGIKRKWKYLLTLYGTTVGINLLLFMVIFPVVANLNSGVSLITAISAAFGRGEELTLSESGSLVTLQVNIPCPGHAPLIIGELKTISGVEAVKFKFPNLFDVGYNPERTSKEQILSLDVFNIYKATIINEQRGQQGNVVKQTVNNTEASQPLTGGCAVGCGGLGGGCGCGCRK